MKTILVALAALALAAEAQSAKAAEPVLLKFGNAGQFGSLSYGMATTPFAEAVMKDSDGAVEVKLFPGPSLASHNNVIDRVKNGVAEIGFGLVGLLPDIFPRTSVAMLPFESTNPHEAGVALMKLLEQGVLEPEMREYKVLALALYANMSVHSKRPVTNLAELKGQKIAVMSKTMADVLDKLGATPITMAPTEFHQSLQRGVVEAAGIGWPGIAPFKLQEVTAHHVQTSLTGEGNFTLMLKSTYDKLPAKGKAAIDKHSGMPFALQWAKAIQAQDDQGIGIVKGANQTIVTLAPAEEAQWKSRAQPVVDAWAANTPDGAKVLAAYRAEIAKVRSAGAAR